jgi:hypothetical protein
MATADVHARGHQRSQLLGACSGHTLTYHRVFSLLLLSLQQALHALFQLSWVLLPWKQP